MHTIIELLFGVIMSITMFIESYYCFIYLKSLFIYMCVYVHICESQEFYSVRGFPLLDNI